MTLENEVIIWFLKGNNETGELGRVIGFIVDETPYLLTVVEVKRKIILGKRSIIKIDTIEKPLKRDSLLKLW